MLPELGLFLLIVAAVVSAAVPVPAFLGLKKRSDFLMNLWKPALAVSVAALTGSVLCLLIAFLNDDFSVAYVAHHSNTQLEVFYKVSAVWGSHEGSMLFWIWIIALWAAAAALFTKRDARFKASSGAVMLGIIGLLSLFLIFTSNPFERLLPLVPPEGRDLNPVLQDIGMIFHPPMLFAGYAGLALCFAGSCAALIGGKFTRKDIATLSAYSVFTWLFLTAGNMLGSWWAYNELGWGGWWFWDPVENSAFIPWLLVSAQLHALLLARYRGQLRATSLFLCIAAFACGMLGSFIVRSGVIQSVHAFASDPNRGVFLLVISVLILLPAFMLFSGRCTELKGEEGEKEEALSVHDIWVTLAVMLMSMASLSVLVGTLYPLFYEMMGWGTLSVGAPYFNTIFAPMVILSALMIAAVQVLKRPVWMQAAVFAVSAALGAAFALATGCKDIWMTGFGVFGAVSLILSTLIRSADKKRNWTALIAHLGIAVSMIGVIGDAQYQTEALVRMGPGQGRPLGDVIFVYDETKKVDTKSFYADEAQVYVLDKDENELMVLKPQRQTFKSNGMEMTAAGIDHGFLRDLYVSMGNKLSADEYLVRLAIKPMVSWIWLGGCLMMIAALVSAALALRRKEN